MCCVNSINVHPDCVSMTKGSWYRDASVEVCPSDAECTEVFWHSSNTSVATVNNPWGHIYAKGPGTARIYATATDGSGCSDYMIVEVSNPVYVECVTLDRTYVSLEKFKKTTLHATVCPENATNKQIIWTSSDTSVATVDPESGLVYAKGVGCATIYACAQDDCCIFDACDVTVVAPTIYCSNAYLTQSQMTVNAQYILDYLREEGWTKNAICGILGNMEGESNINPGIWENFQENNLARGFGLVQWTPATKYINWANDNDLPVYDIDSQLKRILYELDNGEQFYPTQNYPITFSEFVKSTETPEYLAGAFLYNYERPSVYSTLDARASNARKWYNILI